MPFQLTDQQEHPPQCQPLSANRQQLIQSESLINREEVGEGGGREWGKLVENGSACIVQAAVMGAISVLEVQFDNSVQFLAESKSSLPSPFKLGDEARDRFHNE